MPLVGSSLHLPQKKFRAIDGLATPIVKRSTSMSTFRDLGVKPWLVSALGKVGIKTPTPVQTSCIPPILSGRNVIGAAETGTGKTAAFVLPILQMLAEDPFGVAAVVLTPTRELAFQISQQICALGARMAVRDYVLVGGVHELSQASALQKRPHIVVATPGRLSLMIRKDYIDLSRAKYLVLDEADRLLDPAYLEDLKSILSACSRESRQTLMFSATMTPSLEQLQQVAMGEGTFRFDARENRLATVENLTQEYLFIPSHMKETHLVNILKEEYPTQSAIIFVAKCETAELLLTMLNLMGMKKVTALHSDMSQTERIDSLQKFKSQTVRALLATDVASRGLDIPSCELVINYDVPRSVATYVHRVGRTARAGRSGLALSFAAQNDVKLIHAIEENIGLKLALHEGSTEKVIMGNLATTIKARQLAQIRLEDSGFVERNNDRRKEAREAAKKRKKEARRASRAKRRKAESIPS